MFGKDRSSIANVLPPSSRAVRRCGPPRQQRHLALLVGSRRLTGSAVGCDTVTDVYLSIHHWPQTSHESLSSHQPTSDVNARSCDVVPLERCDMPPRLRIASL